MNKYAAIIAFGLSVFVHTHAKAEPQAAEPGRIDERFQERERPELFKTPLIEIDESSNEVSGAAADIKFTLNAVDIEGNSIFSDAELSSITEKYIGRKVSLAEVNQLANEITVKYRNAGYISSKAIVPPQKIKDGRIKIEVIEGGVDEIIIEGDISGNKDRITRLSDKIKSGGAMSTEKLERYLLLIEDLPGVTAKAVIKPSKKPGHSNIHIIISENKADYAIGFDNYSSRYLGEYKLDGQASFNSLFGEYGRTSLHGVITSEIEELKYIAAQHEMQVGSEGTKIIGSASYTDTEPGQALEPLQLEGESFVASLRAEHPFIRSRQENLFGTIGYSHKVSESDSFGARQYRDDVRAVSIGTSYDLFDRFFGTNQADLTFTKGLDIFGASDSSDIRSRSNATGDFEKVNFDYARLQAIPDYPLSVYFATSAQYAWDPLLSSEEFGIGGRQFGRAYDPSEITGDKGLAGSLEFRYLADSKTSIIESYQPFIFYDIGKVWNEDIFVGEAKSISVASAGIGSRFNFIHDISGEILVAVPLTKSIATYGTQGDNPRILFSLTKRF